MIATPPRVLIADSDQSVVQTLSWVLREQGYEVHAADDKESLFRQMEEVKPELLLIDAVRDAAGLDLLSALKGEPRWREIPVLVVADHPPDDAAAWTFGMGAADFLRKPFRVRELLARMEAQLRVRRMLLDAREALRTAESELQRVRDEADSRRRLVDIVHEVTGELVPAEIYARLTRKVGQELGLSHASVVLAQPGDESGLVAAAFENPSLREYPVDLSRYPEITTALEQGRLVLVDDVATSALFAHTRARWENEGTVVAVRSVIVLPFKVDSELSGVLFLRRGHDLPPLGEDDAAFAESVMRAAIAAIQRAHLLEETQADNARLEALAQTDPLTQLLNRRALIERLTAELDRASRYGSMLGLLMVDLDHFKQINDTYGHLFGDEVLRTVARVLANEARSSDVAARYGGEEFVLVLPETGVQGSEVFAERVREEIARLRFQAPNGSTFSMTASIGVACYPTRGVTDVVTLFSSADEALYRAKAGGRNRVSL